MKYYTNDAKNIENEISKIREQLLRIKTSRQQGRENFTENQATFCVRQHYCAQELNRCLQDRVAIGSCYTHAMQELSRSFDESPYIIARQTELCQALHQVEIKTNQVRVLVEYHNNLVNALEPCLSEEIRRSEDIEEDLLRRIRFVSIDMVGRIVENKAALERQEQQISCLKGETSAKEDNMDRIHSDDISLSSFGSSSSYSSPIVSNFLGLKKNVGQTSRRMSIEKRITQVGSYFGIYQTARAA